MKKILTVAAAGAILAATSAVAFAATDNAVIDAAVSGDAVEKGTVTVTLSASSVSGTPGIISGTIKTSGLKLTDQKVSSKMTTVMGAPAIENDVLMLMPSTGTMAKGDEVITLTYEITAAAGQTASFEFAPDASLDMSTTAGNAKWSAKVASAAASDPGTSTPAESKPAESTPTESKPADSTPTESKPADSTSTESKPGEAANPNTGAALALVPIVLASGAAVIVSRKRKK